MKIYGLKRDEILRAIKSSDVSIAVYGLGKMGLPLAAIFANNGANVTGVDINESVVSKINEGENPIPEEPGLTELVNRNVARAKLRATTDLVDAAKQADVMIILVPTLLDENNNPDLSTVKQVCESIAKGLEKGDFVISESTIPPGTSDRVILPILEKSGLRCGSDFGIAHCPERVSSGRTIEDVTTAYPKIVGGVDEKSTATAEALYSVINKKSVITMSNATAAEAVKVFEGIYRDVNIALANQLAMVCDELRVDALEVFNAANTQPYSHLHIPGCGVGGHCIPVYPYFIIETVETDTRLLMLSRLINSNMPKYTVKKVERLLHEEKVPNQPNVLVLGLTFRGGVKELRYSPALEIIRLLERDVNANVFAYDPLLKKAEIEQFAEYLSPDSKTEAVKEKNVDAVVIATDHNEFKEIDWTDFGDKMRNRIVVDGRNIVDAEKLREHGFKYAGIGRLR